MRSIAQRDADARYELKRTTQVVAFRLSPDQLEQLDSQRLSGESRQKAIIRLLLL